jgi:hypothetical protein
VGWLCALFPLSAEQNRGSSVSVVGKSIQERITVPSQNYLIRQIATLLKFAKVTGDPKAAAALLDKAADLNEKVENLSLAKMDPERAAAGRAGRSLSSPHTLALQFRHGRVRRLLSSRRLRVSLDLLQRLMSGHRHNLMWRGAGLG